jgi:hypothetical protein
MLVVRSVIICQLSVYLAIDDNEEPFGKHTSNTRLRWESDIYVRNRFTTLEEKDLMSLAVFVLL